MNEIADNKREYTTELSKGQGAISETLTLLEYWERGMSADELATEAVERGALGRSTETRTRDLVTRVFARRYLVDEGRPARVLQTLRGQVPLSVLKQFMLVYTARQHDILHDFITEVYWPKYEAGADQISRSDARSFIEEAHAMGMIDPGWSETMIVRVARYLAGTLSDFGFLEDSRKSTRDIQSVRVDRPLVVYLPYEIHFDGYSDNSILEHPDWALFGLMQEDIVRRLKQASYDGHFIIQYSGELLRLSWEHESLEECLHAIA
jgi:hypothetical protein